MIITLEQAILLLSLLFGGSIIGAIVSLYGARSARRAAEAGAENSEASAIKQYAETTALYALEVKSLRDELKRLRNEILKRDRVIDHLNELLIQRNIAIEDLQDWAERLVKQLETHTEGIEIEKLRTRENIVIYRQEDIDGLSLDAAMPTETVPLRRVKKSVDRRSLLKRIFDLIFRDL